MVHSCSYIPGRFNTRDCIITLPMENIYVFPPFASCPKLESEHNYPEKKTQEGGGAFPMDTMDNILNIESTLDLVLGCLYYSSKAACGQASSSAVIIRRGI